MRMMDDKQAKKPGAYYYSNWRNNVALGLYFPFEGRIWFYGFSLPEGTLKADTIRLEDLQYALASSEGHRKDYAEELRELISNTENATAEQKTREATCRHWEASFAAKSKTLKSLIRSRT